MKILVRLSIMLPLLAACEGLDATKRTLGAKDDDKSKPSEASDDGGADDSGADGADGSDAATADAGADDAGTADAPDGGTDAEQPGHDGEDADNGNPEEPEPLTSHTIFVTSEGYNGNLGGLTGADAKCQQHADDASLTGTWKALISDSKGAIKDRFTFTLPIYNTKQELVAAAGQFVWNKVDKAINYTEKGDLAGGTGAPNNFETRYTWTYSLHDGSIVTNGRHCADWTSDSATDYGGGTWTFAVDAHWINAGFTIGCDKLNALYCINQ